MKKDKFLLTVALILVFYTSACGQRLRSQYVIFTYEDTYKVSQHKAKSYYWIQPIDSIKSKPNGLSALILFGFTKDIFNNNCDGLDVNPFLVSPDASYNYDKEYLRGIDDLTSLISNNRRLIQTIKKLWSSGQSEVINIYVTPISGVFCSSNFLKRGLYSSNYSGRVYLPSSDFLYNKSFWDSFTIHDFVEDYSKVRYDAFPGSANFK